MGKALAQVVQAAETTREEQKRAHWLARGCVGQPGAAKSSQAQAARSRPEQAERSSDFTGLVASVRLLHQCFSLEKWTRAVSSRLQGRREGKTFFVLPFCGFSCKFFRISQMKRFYVRQQRGAGKSSQEQPKANIWKQSRATRQKQGFPMNCCKCAIASVSAVVSFRNLSSIVRSRLQGRRELKRFLGLLFCFFSCRFFGACKAELWKRVQKSSLEMRTLGEA